MSADNGIYILVTTDMHKWVNEYTTHNMTPDGIKAYRVAHAQTIDSLHYHEKRQKYNLGWCMDQFFGNCPVFYNEDEAYDYAKRLEADIGYTEYGICLLDFERYRYPGC